MMPAKPLTQRLLLHGLVVQTRGGRLLGPGTRLPPPPPPPRALRAHLVTKGQWLLTIHMVAPKAPEIFFFIPLAHIASLPAQAVEHPNAILEPNLDSNAHPNPQPAPNPTPNPTHDPNPNPNSNSNSNPNPNQD